MGRRKRNTKKIGSGDGLQIRKVEEGRASQPVDVSAGLADRDEQSSGRVQETPAQSQDPSTTDAEYKEKEALVKEILQMRARLRELDVIRQQQDMILEERRAKSARLKREAQQAVAACELERRRHNNTLMLQAAGLLNGRGLINKLEERWTKASQHRNISQLKRWHRWAILATEHAEELQAVTMHGERLITADVLDNLVPILRELHKTCVRNQGWWHDRLWIEADYLRPHGGNVLMALCQCFELCFTCIDKGRVKNSNQKIKTDEETEIAVSSRNDFFLHLWFKSQESRRLSSS